FEPIPRRRLIQRPAERRGHSPAELYRRFSRAELFPPLWIFAGARSPPFSSQPDALARESRGSPTRQRGRASRWTVALRRLSLAYASGYHASGYHAQALVLVG